MILVLALFLGSNQQVLKDSTSAEAGALMTEDTCVVLFEVLVTGCIELLGSYKLVRTWVISLLITLMEMA